MHAQDDLSDAEVLDLLLASVGIVDGKVGDVEVSRATNWREGCIAVN